MLEEIEITCPSCGAELTIEADETMDEIACEECGYEFYPGESFDKPPYLLEEE